MARSFYSRSFRFWHWLNAVAILGLLGTALLRETLLSAKANAAVLQAELAKLGMQLSESDAVNIAKTIREPLWDWHVAFGFLLIALMLWRIVLHFRERSIWFVDKALRAPNLEKKGVYTLYGLVYLFIIFMGVTGVTMYFHDSFGLTHEEAHEIAEIHEIGFYFFLFFVPAHIIGVFLAENRGEHGLISRMIGEGDVTRK